MEIERHVTAIESVLDAHRAALGGDYDGYHHHAHRVFHLARRFAGDAPGTVARLATACAFHDLGIWADGTFDYLAPSAERARQWLLDAGRADDVDTVLAMIAQHHKVTAYAGDGEVEAFRRADWIDVTMGALRFGVPWRDVRALQRALPDAGFHARLVALTARQAITDPLHMLPMFRW